MSRHRHGSKGKRGRRGQRVYYTPDAVADFARREWAKQRGDDARDRFKGDFVVGNPPFTVNRTKGE